MLNVSIQQGENVLKLLLHKSSGGTELLHPYHFDLMLAEYLRKNIHSMYMVGEYFEPIYITRIINTVAKQINPLLQYAEQLGIPKYSKEQLETIVRRTLNRLRDIKDVVELGRGYWAPAPIRFIDVPKNANALVVGSLPTYDLNILFGPIIKVAGFMRFIDKFSLLYANPQYPVFWQEFGSWIGEIPSNLPDWTRQIMISANEQLRQSADKYENFEVYCAWTKNKLQHYRWLEYEDFKKTINTNPTELILLRSKRRPRVFWFGRFSSTVLESEASVSNGIIRRLLYGLDLFYNNVVEATWTGNIITFNNWLPPEEIQILSAVGMECSTEIGKLPLKYNIHPEWKGLVDEQLRCLGLRIREDRNE